MAETLTGEDHDHRHGHSDCRHDHVISERLNQVWENAQNAPHGGRLRQALVIGTIGVARIVTSSFCPLDDILPLAIQVINPAAVTHSQDQLGIMPRGWDSIENGTLRLKRHSYDYPLDGPEPPAHLPFAELLTYSEGQPETDPTMDNE